MTTRHTISHADEIYSGNAYDQYYSPDGRRGLVRSHLYVHKFLSTAAAAPIAKDSDGILSSYATPSLIGYTGTAAANFIGMCTGALTSNGATVISLDVPRNVTITCCGNSNSCFLKIHGRDIHGSPIAETIKGPTAGTTVSGVRAFKEIDKMYTTNRFGGVVSIGTGNRLGLPFNLRDTNDIVSVTINGKTNTSGATGYFVAHIGASYATTITTSAGQLDAKGSIEFVNPAPDGTAKPAICYQVYPQTQRTAFGPPTPSSCSNGV